MITKVFCLLRNLPAYPVAEVVRGLNSCGVEVIFRSPDENIDDYSDAAIITWNNYGRFAKYANLIKARGGLHISLENGYTNSFRDIKTYALSINEHHTVNHEWTIQRNRCINRHISIDFLPFRGYVTNKKDGPIIIFGQRGGGYSGMAMPNDWPDKIIQQIRSYTSRDIIFKSHPFKNRVPMEPHKNVKIVTDKCNILSLIDTAHSCVVFTSNTSTECLVRGVPVAYCGPSIPLKNLASTDLSNTKSFTEDERRAAFTSLIGSEFTKAEIQSGIFWKFARAGL